LVGKVFELKHNDVFKIDEGFEMRALYTPGHASDHFSMLMANHSLQEKYLFSGDIILGTPSTSL
jgi:glyoxylase-like metal-dependent hydrolase (beta-lactamase superfamily II)